MQAFEEVQHLGFLLDVFDLLNDLKRHGRHISLMLVEVGGDTSDTHIQVGCSRSTDVDEDRLDQGSLGEILNLSRHRCREQEGLTLVL